MRFLQSFGLFTAGALVALAGTVAAQQVSITDFSDVLGVEYFANAVERFSNLGIIRGYESGRFGPNDALTRAQLVVILDRYDKTVVEPLRRQIAELRGRNGLPTCGDGILDVAEECDDANIMSGDGCSAVCTREQLATCEGGRVQGEKFPAPDGCNTCTCGPTGIVCTELACVRPGFCYASNQCGGGKICSTELGECLSTCPLGVVCHDICAGTCVTAPRTISSCGNGVCEEWEDGICLVDCDPGVLSSTQSTRRSCQDRKLTVESLLKKSYTCTQDSDCVLFEASCPYLTCGVAVSREGEFQLRTEVSGYQKECDGSTSCASSCPAVHPVCERGMCTLKAGFAIN
jgi:cysteine-rich repeat protein